MPNAYRYGFNGQENDNEVKGDGNEIEYGMRTYDPRLGRFFSPDPLTKMYPMMSPYSYAINNPIRFIDVNGEAPGDPFKSPHEAANDWGKTYNGISIRKNREYASTIFKVEKDGEIYYTYNRARKGSLDGSTPKKAPRGTQTIADIHSHAAYDEALDATYSTNPDEAKVDFNNEFSASDIGSNSIDNINGYLATPDGSLKLYEPQNNNISVLNTNLQSDPNDPRRKNNLSPDTDYSTATKEAQERDKQDVTGAPYESGGKVEQSSFE